MKAMTQPPNPPQSSPQAEAVLQPELPLDFAAFLTPAVAMTPTYVDSPTAAEQLPFLFWLFEATHPRVVVDVGATDATAYFGLCQAAEALRRDVRCHLGAVALGRDAQSVAKIQRWIEHQNSHHGARSQIIGGGTDELAATLQEGVDLLLVHAAAVPRKELQRWKADILPKLASHSIIFLDDLGEGPHALFDGLASQGPAFRFRHGNGFGVVAGGSSPPKLLQYLGACADDDRSAGIIRSLFQRLGQGCRHDVDQRESRRQRRKIRTLSEELAHVREDLGLASSQLVAREAEISELRDRLTWNREQLQKSQQQSAALQIEATETREALMAERSVLEAAKRLLEAELAESTEARERCRGELDLVHASRSWKLTAPLRWAAARFRR